MSMPALLFVILNLSLVSLAQAAQESATERPAPSPLDGGVLFETLIGLVVVVGLILALGWFLRRFGGLPVAGKGVIRVLGGISLGPRERAVLLQIGETRLLVGVAPGRVQTLHVLEGDSAVADDECMDGFSRQLEAERQRQ